MLADEILDFNSISDLEEREFFLKIDLLGKSLVQFLTFTYHYLGPAVEIEIIKSGILRAYSFEQGSKCVIRITVGMINHCLQIPIESQEETFARISALGTLGTRIVSAPLLWIIAHEFFHIARGHQELRSRNLEKYSQATEYDADCFSAAGIYRYLQEKFSPLTELGLKIICLKAFYRTMRPFIGTEKIIKSPEKNHPKTYLRLRYAIYKISALDAPSPNFGLTQTWSDRFGLLTSEYVKAEREYLESVGAADRKSEYFKFTVESMRDEADAPLQELVEKWSAIEAEVLAHSKLLLDMMQSGKKICIHHPTHGMIFMHDGWRYAAGKLTGFFVPRFHLKKGLPGQSIDYGAESALVTPIWVAGSQRPW